MNGVQIATSVLSLISGVGIFLIACNMMSANLEALGSGKLKKLFSKTAKSKLAGVGIGAAATAAVQSSGATTVMVIGFVNAGIMTLAQAATVIFGANIGTTVTGQLVALGLFGGNSISASVIFAATAGIGAFMLAFAKKDIIQKIGGITAGFGMLFTGLNIMSGSMQYFAELNAVKNFLAFFTNPLLLALIGAVFTALVQSSSVMTSVAITMTAANLITLNQGIYITMGSNIGSCITALIAGFTSTRLAKRAALIHLIFNVSGVAAFMIAGLFMGIGGVDYGQIFSAMFPNAPQLQMSMFHTAFNVITVIIILPFTNLLVKTVTAILPDKSDGKSSEARFKYVEEHLLATPPVAVLQVKKEIMNMAEIAHRNFNDACEYICTLDGKRIESFAENEKTLNFLNRELSRFIVKLLKADLSEKDRIYLSTAIRSAADFERVGDYAENITEYSAKLKETGGSFSAEAIKEITALKQKVSLLFEQTMKAYSKQDQTALSEALNTEDCIDAAAALMTDGHIKRLENGECTPEVGAQYLSLAANMERVADHYVNVAKTVKSML